MADALSAENIPLLLSVAPLRSFSLRGLNVYAPRGLDQRRDNAALLVLLGVPDDPQGETPLGQLDRLDQFVVLRPTADRQALAQPLETTIGLIPGVVEMSSFSGTGGTDIVTQFDLTVDLDTAAGAVQAAINAAGPDLPKGQWPPVYWKSNPAGFAVISLALTSDVLPAGEVYDLADGVIGPKLSQLPGVARVYITGGEKSAVRIQVSPSRMAAMNLSLEAASLYFFCSSLLGAISFPVAAWLARRIGLINTMVFTHIPSSLCLIAAAFSSSLTVVLSLLLVRSALSQMDVPTRSSYVMAVVTPAERTAAASVTAVPRSLASSISPAMAGFMLAGPFSGLPLVVCGCLKIGYDLALLRMFRHTKPPEETR